MDTRQERTLRTLQSILDYTLKPPLQSPPPLLLEKRTELQGCIDRVMALTTEQLQARQLKSGYVTHKVAALRRKRMMPLAKIARPMLSYAPGAEEALKVPHARTDAATVAARAVAMAEFLELHTDLLESAQVSREFLAEFRAEAEALASVASRSRDARQRLSSATSKITEELRTGMRAVTVIDGLLQVHLPAVELRSWETYKRKPKRIGRPPKKKPRRRAT